MLPPQKDGKDGYREGLVRSGRTKEGIGEADDRVDKGDWGRYVR